MLVPILMLMLSFLDSWHLLLPTGAVTSHPLLSTTRRHLRYRSSSLTADAAPMLSVWHLEAYAGLRSWPSQPSDRQGG